MGNGSRVCFWRPHWALSSQMSIDFALEPTEVLAASRRIMFWKRTRPDLSWGPASGLFPMEPNFQLWGLTWGVSIGEPVCGACTVPFLQHCLGLAGWCMCSQWHSVWACWFLRVLLLGEVVLRVMRELENSFGQRAESFCCVHSVSQPSICELVLAGRGVSHLRDCHNWALMVVYPCTVLFKKCQMGTKCVQTRIRQWWLRDITIGQCSQVEKSLPRCCKGSSEAKTRLLLHPLAADGKDSHVLNASSVERDR